MIYELDFNNKKELKKINKFLENNNSDYMQSVEWHKIRNEKTKYFIYFKNENGRILWTCNLLLKLKNKKPILYAPRGPILTTDTVEGNSAPRGRIFNLKDSKLFNHFLFNIKNWMKDKNYTKIVLNPYISLEIIKNIPKEYNYFITKNNDYQNLYDSCKLAIMDIIFDENELINKLPSKFRQNTRRSYRKNLKCRISKKIDFDNFYKLYIETADRHNFKPHSIDYFKNIYSVFNKNLIFLEVWYNDFPLAMSIDIIYNNKLIYLYGVSSSSNRNLLGMYNLQWEAFFVRKMI